MNSTNQTEYESQRLIILEKKGYTDEMLKTFRSNIQKNVKPEDAAILGKKLLALISAKGYSNLDKDGQIIEATQLIFAGANLEIKDEKNGDTALIICAKKNLYATFSLLVKSGANINAQNNFFSTATMWSARQGYLEILNDLILLKANINLRCKDGDTASHSAVRHNQIKSVKALILAGAILNAPNNLGQDLLAIAQEKEHNELLEIILAAMAIQNPFIECTKEKVAEEIRLAREKLNSFR